MKWIEDLREYYKDLIASTVRAFRERMPELVVSNSDASIYFVVDFKKIDPDFDAKAFVNFCAREGRVDEVPVNGKPATLFLAPMEGFTQIPQPEKTQMRVAVVKTEDQMLLAPNYARDCLNNTAAKTARNKNYIQGICFIFYSGFSFSRLLVFS